MIGQYFVNTNKNATISVSQIFLELNKAQANCCATDSSVAVKTSERGRQTGALIKCTQYWELIGQRFFGKFSDQNHTWATVQLPWPKIYVMQFEVNWTTVVIVQQPENGLALRAMSGAFFSHLTARFCLRDILKKKTIVPKNSAGCCRARSLFSGMATNAVLISTGLAVKVRSSIQGPGTPDHIALHPRVLKTSNFMHTFRTSENSKLLFDLGLFINYAWNNQKSSVHSWNVETSTTLACWSVYSTQDMHLTWIYVTGIYAYACIYQFASLSLIRQKRFLHPSRTGAMSRKLITSAGWLDDRSRLHSLNDVLTRCMHACYK